MVQEHKPYILIADDDRDDFLAIEIACEELAFKVLLSHVGYSHALMNALETHTPDLLLLDIQMPTQSGKLSLKELRANRKYDTLPIIMYSSIADPDTIDFCFKEGANLFFIKPNTFKELNFGLKKIMEIDWKKEMFYPTRESFVLNENTQKDLTSRINWAG